MLWLNHHLNTTGSSDLQHELSLQLLPFHNHQGTDLTFLNFFPNMWVFFYATVGEIVALFSSLDFRLLSICVQRYNWLLCMDLLPRWYWVLSFNSVIMDPRRGCLLTGCVSADHVVPSLSSVDAPLPPCLSVRLYKPLLSWGWVC